MRLTQGQHAAVIDPDIRIIGSNCNLFRPSLHSQPCSKQRLRHQSDLPICPLLFTHGNLHTTNEEAGIMPSVLVRWVIHMDTKMSCVKEQQIKLFLHSP